MAGLFDNGFGGKLPGFSIANGTPYGGGLTNGGFTEDASFIPWNNANPIYTYRDNVTKIIRSHNLTFGVNFHRRPEKRNQRAGLQNGGFLDLRRNFPR